MGRPGGAVVNRHSTATPPIFGASHTPLPVFPAFVSTFNFPKQLKKTHFLKVCGKTCSCLKCSAQTQRAMNKYKYNHENNTDWAVL